MLSEVRAVGPLQEELEHVFCFFSALFQTVTGLVSYEPCRCHQLHHLFLEGLSLFFFCFPERSEKIFLAAVLLWDPRLDSRPLFCSRSLTQLGVAVPCP